MPGPGQPVLFVTSGRRPGRRHCWPGWECYPGRRPPGLPGSRCGTRLIAGRGPAQVQGPCLARISRSCP